MENQLIEQIKDLNIKIVNHLKNNISHDLVANPYINFLNSSEKVVIKYLPLFQKKSFLNPLLKNLAKSIYKLFSCFICFDKGLILNKIEKTDILFISHLIETDQTNKLNDPYFGKLPIEIHRQDKNISNILINHTKQNPKKIYEKLNIPFLKIILPRYDKNLREIIVFFRLFFLIITQLLKLVFNRDIEDKNFLLHSISFQLSSTSLANIRISNQIEKYISILNPKHVFLTWEGHGWERLVCKKIKEIDPSINIYGYNHSIMFYGPKALERKYGFNYDPDKLLLSGKIQRDILKISSDYSSNSLIVIGSPKFSKPQINFKKKPLSESSCLIIPEGTYFETQLLSNFSLDLAKNFPNRNFILRLHPLISISSLRNISKEFRKNYLPKNLEISKSLIINDLQKCSWVIYRSSSLAIECINYGLRPIFLKSTKYSEKSDYIDSMVKWKKSVKNTEEVYQILFEDIQNYMYKKIFNETPEYKFAKKYAENYFTKFNHLEINKIL